MPDPPPWNIVLVGFMGTGKTTVGRLLAEKLGAEFVDTDEEVVRSAGKPITRIFEERGEEGFRELETAAVRGLLDRKGMVVSCGGGIVLREQNRASLRELGFVVWLTASEETILRRVLKNKERPLVLTEDPRETVRRLLEERQGLYDDAHHLKVDGTDLTAEEVAFGIKECAQHHFAAGSPGPTGAPHPPSGRERDS